ncbi:MAG: RDD family protein [Phycisphaerae bacterium]
MTDQPSQFSPGSPGAAESQSSVARCTITKKWFPEDELVTFQGQRVSAEGKQILLDRLLTGAEAPGKPICPTRWNRLWCICLDWLVITLCWYAGMVPVVFILVRLLHLDFASFVAKGVVMFLLLGTISVGYFAFMHGRKGKSIGKMAGSLLVVNLDGSPISRLKAAARAVVYCGAIFLFVAVLLSMGAWHPTKIHLVAIGSLTFVCLIWGLLDIICAVFDTRTQRSLHDRICGTRVIWEG